MQDTGRAGGLRGLGGFKLKRCMCCVLVLLIFCRNKNWSGKDLQLHRSVREGVLFCTYSSLVSGLKGGGRGTRRLSRLDQLVEWLGGDSFEGVLVFDEVSARTICSPHVVHSIGSVSSSLSFLYVFVVCCFSSAIAQRISTKTKRRAHQRARPSCNCKSNFLVRASCTLQRRV